MKNRLCFLLQCTTAVGFIAIFFIFGLISCQNKDKDKVVVALALAGDNSVELRKVLDHYQKSGDKEPLKLKAALFLIQNMPRHHSVQSESIDTYQARVYRAAPPIPMETLNTWWGELGLLCTTQVEHDVHTLKADFLIENIDKAFEVWRAAPWKDEINFESFCQYILPYRFQNELLAEHWRDSLYNEYHPFIAGVKEMPKAFAIIHNTVAKQVASGSSKFPYIIHVLAMKHQAKATCIQQCVLLGSVLRALGLPAAIDNVGMWANYSTNAHSWVSLVTKEGVYTVYEKDTVAQLNNEIDSSVFTELYQTEKGYPLDTDFKKRCAKIWRSTYAYQEIPQHLDVKWKVAQLLSNPFNKDVSREYNFTNRVEVGIESAADHAYLCTFATGRDWEPVSCSEKKNGKSAFAHLGDSVAYLAVVYNDEKATAVENPFLMLNHRKVSLTPNHSVTQQMVLTRKYPLTHYWVNVYAPMIGARFEGSNQPSFKQKDILYTVPSTPVFKNEIKLEGKKSYRYVRYVSPQHAKTSLAEIECWWGDTLLRGEPFGVNADGAEHLFDGDTFTILNKQSNGYVVGIDFGKPMPLDRLVYYPRNDGNFVVPKHEYELFYYNMQWNSLGSQVSTGVELAYNNVPTNALYLLRNKTAGKEERIFTYENNKQVWW